MKIFLSWSGKRSKAIAAILNNWLPRVLQASKPWCSTFDINKGHNWSEAVGKSLADHDLGIICVTPENYKSPWLLFEAGALSKALGDSHVCPLLFGISASELSGPLAQLQATIIDPEDMLKLIKTLNSKAADTPISENVLEDAFNRLWPELESSLNDVAKIKIAASREKIDRVIQSFSKHGLPEPVIGGEAYFKNGFESHGLYSSVMEIANDRLYIFGRKNRKVFDKDHHDFLRELPSRIKSGFDFRVLFLDPESPNHVLDSAHQDKDFREKLAECIANAKQALNAAGLDPSKHCRLYNVQRTTTILLVDDALLFTPIRIASDGRVEHLTKASFTVINSTSEYGIDLLSMFEKQWQSARPLP